MEDNASVDGFSLVGAICDLIDFIYDDYLEKMEGANENTDI